MRFSWMFIAFSLGCAAPLLRVEAEKQDRQDVVYKAGLPVVTSLSASSEVVLQPPAGTYGLEDRVSYAVAIRNLGKARVEVADSSIRAWANGEPAIIMRPLQRTTLEPGETVTAGIVLDTTRWLACPTAASRRLNQQSYRVAGPCRWVVTVAVGSDLHSFIFNESIETRQVSRP
jgi:hypothetical protein